MVLDKETWDDLSNYRDYLEHYGVKGMRWGVRKDRDQGSSSSPTKMTFLQKRKQQRAAKEAEAKKKKKAAEKKKAAAAAQKAARKREQILRSPTKLYKNRYDFSQDEINDALKRFKWEAELQSYSQKQMAQGKQYIDTVFQYANSAINVYNTAARVVNSFDLSDTPWKYIETATPKKEDKKKNSGS